MTMFVAFAGGPEFVVTPLMIYQRLISTIYT